MNIYDVSEKAGVSIATVSRVLNGNPNVSEPTRQKVLNVMKEIGYTPNVFARGLGLNTMHTIGIMCADSSDPFLANAVYYLEQNLRQAYLCYENALFYCDKEEDKVVIVSLIEQLISEYEVSVPR